MDPKVTKIDGVNYVRREFTTATGQLQLEGLTVRALKKALETYDPDTLVCYMAEMTPETRNVDLLIGVIAGMAGTEPGVLFLFGPEGVRGAKDAGLIP